MARSLDTVGVDKCLQVWGIGVYGDLVQKRRWGHHRVARITLNDRTDLRGLLTSPCSDGLLFVEQMLTIDWCNNSSGSLRYLRKDVCYLYPDYLMYLPKEHLNLSYPMKQPSRSFNCTKPTMIDSCLQNNDGKQILVFVELFTSWSNEYKENFKDNKTHFVQIGNLN